MSILYNFCALLLTTQQDKLECLLQIRFYRLVWCLLARLSHTDTAGHLKIGPNITRTNQTRPRLRKFRKEKHTSLSSLALVDKEKGFAASKIFPCYKKNFYVNNNKLQRFILAYFQVRLIFASKLNMLLLLWKFNVVLFYYVVPFSCLQLFIIMVSRKMLHSGRLLLSSQTSD